MGTTLTNGVYLPNEGERNCYAGLKTNWEILDQKVADVTALQQAVAGALHREIVESLPTTDIDPNTIYMILSGTSATENVYNEFMYVNNAWELIGTSATDLTNYYTKGEVDGLLLLKANVSDLTSHTGDTTIHVTTADKTKWNNGVSQSYVLRYSSSSVTDNSTIAYSTLDNTDNVKSGDKVIDVDGKIFSVVSVDTTNQTVTVGSALIDLALDANVVHTSGNETVGGVKSFSDDTYIKSLNFTNEFPSRSSSSSSIMPMIVTITYGDSSPSVQARLNFRITADGTKSLYPHENNQYSLGLLSRRWSSFFGYFVNLGGVYLGNEASTNQRTNLYLLANRDTDGQSGCYVTRYRQNKAQGALAFSDQQQIGIDFLENSVRTTNIFNIVATDWTNDVPGRILINSGIANNSFGSVTRKCLINELNPSALSMPDLNNGIDISSYITIGNTDDNYYIPPVNGWIWAKMLGNGLAIQQGDFGSYANYVADSTTGDKYIEACLLVTKNVQATIRCRGITSIVSAKFYPCQGNV